MIATKTDMLILLLIFIFIYGILYLDHKLVPKCKNKDCYLNSKRISLKSSIAITLICFIIYKISIKYIINYMHNSVSTMNRTIITDMVDF